jgi:hypothetical protein
MNSMSSVAVRPLRGTFFLVKLSWISSSMTVMSCRSAQRAKSA